MHTARSDIYTHTHRQGQIYIHIHTHTHRQGPIYAHIHIHIPVPPVFGGKFSKIPRKYFMNSVADLSKFRNNSVEIILSFYINYK